MEISYIWWVYVNFKVDDHYDGKGIKFTSKYLFSNVKDEETQGASVL